MKTSRYTPAGEQLAAVEGGRRPPQHGSLEMIATAELKMGRLFYLAPTLKVISSIYSDIAVYGNIENKRG